MSIQQISYKELLENGVQALPNRPSTPSLYSGNAMSAHDLKAAFDRLPTLIAERFNDLLRATGLFDENDPKNSLAELISTDIFPEHSLAQFFEDVESGALALYLKADGKNSLADVITALREELARVDTYQFKTEGEGELLSDVTVAPDGITFHRGHPAAEVQKEDSRPVSSDAVHSALSPLSERISLLEEGARGILFQYPEIDCPYYATYAPSKALSHAALIKLGASTFYERNYFPEKILSLYRGDTLSITWDEAQGCLVLNGSLPPSKEITPLVPFRFRMVYDYYSACILHRGGTVHTEDDTQASLCLVIDKSRLFEISLLNEDSVMCGDYSSYVEICFSYVGIRAPSGVSFDNYRINFYMQDDTLDEPDYVPCITSDTEPLMPTSLTVTGPNIWHGDAEKHGEGYVTFLLDEPFPAGDYVFSLHLTSNSPDDGGCVVLTMENGKTYTRKITKNRRSSFTYSTKSPIVDIRVYAANTVDTSGGYSLSVRDFQIEIQDQIRDVQGAFGAPLSQSLTLPHELAHFRNRFFALSNEKFNYFDFEERCFHESIFRFVLDGSLSFSAVGDSDGTFSAPCTPPAALLTGKYRPRRIFLPLTDEYGSEESVWFTNDAVFIKSKLFDSAEALIAFLSHTPVDVLYEDKPVRHPLQTEACAAPILLSMRPCADTVFYDAAGEKLSVNSTIQYQVYM